MRSPSSCWWLALLLAASASAAAQDAGRPDDVTVTRMDGADGVHVDGCRLDGGAAAAVFGRAGLAGTRELWLADTHLTRDALDALLLQRVEATGLPGGEAIERRRTAGRGWAVRCTGARAGATVVP